MTRQPFLLYIFLAVVILGVFGFVYVRPKYGELKTVKADRTMLEAEVAELRVKKQQMDKIEAEMRTLSMTLKDLETIIPEKREISDILNRFQQLAFDSRLNITKFSPKGEIPMEFYAEWPIPIEITGNFNNLGVFFDRLSRFSRLFTIEKFTIKSLNRQTDAATITASFTSKTYIFLDRPPAPPEMEGAPGAEPGPSQPTGSPGGAIGQKRTVP